MTPDDHTHTAPPDATRDQSEVALDAGLAAAFGGDTTRDSRPLGAAGEVVGGRYHLIDEVGSGGMGSVWRAEQKTPVKRYVAVKLVKPGMDSKAVLARFDAERQALAVMDHPNIARVFDGGVTVDGRPYFVMELVKGTPITTFADARKLTPKQRLELFVPVCSAIQHAHMKGVIHRDIKPSNVLVALYDDKAVPKVIDFGVAKATGAALTDHTLHTGLGAVVGTPEYMSPEQASLNNLDIDTRSDVYALGVLLYELLTGSPPFTRKELEQAGLLELLRVVREVEPPRPSVKLSTAAAKPSIAANRGSEPTALTKLLRSELDWVVMKALEKDRNRRYESANGFAADVQRYLAGEAVQAVPPSLGYRVRKWVRKNRGLVTAAGLVAASLLAGTGVATWQAIRAEHEAAKTKDALAQSEKNREQAELNLVHSFLRPIGFNIERLDEAELIALDELARQEDDRIKLLFLREALADGEQALRVARRAERVTQAAVGTSLKRRANALELTTAKQRDKNADPRIRLAACLLAIEFGGDDLPALGDSLTTLLTQKVLDWSSFIDHLPPRIHPDRVPALADVLVALIHQTTDEDALRAAGELTVLALRLDPTAAGRMADGLVKIVGQTTNWYTLQSVSSWLSALAPRIPPSVVGRTTDALVAVIDNTTNGDTLWVAAGGLATLAPRLDPVAARVKFARAVDTLTKVLAGLPRSDILLGTARGVASLAPWLDAATAGKAADALAAVLGKSTDRYALEVGSEALAALAPRLDPPTVQPTLAKATDALITLLGQQADNSMRHHAASSGLIALAPRLDPAATERVAAALVGICGNTTDVNVRRVAADVLPSMAPLLDPVAARRTFGTLVVVFDKGGDNHHRWVVAGALAALAERLDPAVTQPMFAKAFDTLTAAMRNTAHEYEREGAAEALAALAPRFDTAAADKAADALVDVLSRLKAGYTQRTVAKGLAGFAARLNPSVAHPKLVRAVDALLEMLRKESDGRHLEVVASLAVLAPHLDPVTAGRAFDAVLDELVKFANGDALQATGPGLVALAPRLKAARQADRCAEALRRVIKLIRSIDVYSSSSLYFFPFADSPATNLVNHLDTLPSLVDLLRDPGCVGELQSAVLARLEQLAYPDPGQVAVFAGLAADPLRAVTLPALQKVDDDHRKLNRRFRTVSDAAKWLAEHHPEIDLDKPYHKAAPAK